MRRDERYASSPAADKENDCKYENTNPQHENSFKTGIGTDQRIPFWPEKLQGPKEKSDFRLLKISSRRPSSSPTARLPNKAGVHVLLARFKSNTRPLLPLVTEGHSGASNYRSQAVTKLTESGEDAETRVKAIDEEAARIV